MRHRGASDPKGHILDVDEVRGSTPLEPTRKDVSGCRHLAAIMQDGKAPDLRPFLFYWRGA